MSIQKTRREGGRREEGGEGEGDGSDETKSMRAS